MKKIQLTWFIVILILAAVAVVTFIFWDNSWTGSEKGIVLDGNHEPPIVDSVSDNVEISRRRDIIESFYPKLKDFENQESFTGQRVKTVIDGNDYYFAYITEGSGVPIAAATCFKVDSEYKLYYIGDLADSSAAAGENYNDVDPLECEGVKIPLSSTTDSGNEAGL